MHLANLCLRENVAPASRRQFKALLEHPHYESGLRCWRDDGATTGRDLSARWIEVAGTRVHMPSLLSRIHSVGPHDIFRPLFHISFQLKALD